MAASTGCGETTKESLSPDDIQAKCDIYPRARDPGTCDRVGADTPSPGDDVFGRDGPGSSDGRGCCDSSGADPGASMALAALTLARLKRRRATARSLRGGRIR